MQFRESQPASTSDNAACLLQHYPYKTVRLVCSKCDRQERFDKAKLIAAHGSDVSMRELQQLIVRCDRTRNRKSSCGAFFPDLING